MSKYAKFDMRSFLNFYNIPFKEHSNISTDAYFAVDCFDCGKEDGLGIPKDGAVYGTCWKCGYKNAYKVIEGLTGESNVKAILKQFSTGYISNVGHKVEDQPTIKRPAVVKVPGRKDWHPNLLAWQYLEKERHFNPSEIIQKYDLRYSIHGEGKHSYRITFPFYYGGKVVCFQSRTYTDNPIRFINSEPTEEIMHSKHILYGLDDCSSDSVLIVEGLMDKIRVGNNCAAVCGTSTTIMQSNLLRSKYKRVFLLFDQGEPEAQEKAEKFAYQIGSGRTEVEILNITNEKVDPDKYFYDNPDDLICLKKELRLY